MGPRKEKRMYYFSVEGETELWYLDWLKQKLSEAEGLTCQPVIVAKKQEPLAFVKSQTLLFDTTIYRWSDYESAEDVHVQNFQWTMERMKKAEEEKDVTYSFGYSNFAFDLWIILHKAECNGSLTHRKQYIDKINRTFKTHFEDMDDYKHENNFKGLLAPLTLDDVVQAIKWAKKIRDNNQKAGYPLKNYKGFEYYEVNPATMVWESVEKILTDCGYIK